jgi:NADPH-dependent 2,4-dienoyl-CoA reductase/sulfur reductase-like enzyme
VIIGASLAGLRAAETLRQRGFDGEVVLVGAEPHLPYDRPPLSKGLLAGTIPVERIALRGTEAYHDLDLTLRLGVRATALDADGRTVTLHDGHRSEVLPFDGCVIATGGDPRWPAGWPHPHELGGLFALRTLDDCVGLRAVLEASPRRVVVVGAGFIGAEVAATARHMGVEVTVLEALPVPLVRALGPSLGAAVSAIHRRHGTDLRTGVGVEGVVGHGRIEQVRLADGTVLDADAVVVGIGVTPATGWLEGSGLTLRDGIVCDTTLRAAPRVYAAGDVARWPNLRYGDPGVGEEMRIEHWSNANEQGALAGANLLAELSGGVGSAYDGLPFFWSDQYDAKIQMLGRPSGDLPGDRAEIVLGDADGHFVAMYGRGERVRGVLGVGFSKPLMSFRKPLLGGMTWDEGLAHIETYR